MEHRFWRNVIAFLLTFALTVFVVGILSRATTAEAETASARYSEQVRASQAAPATEVTAPVYREPVSPLKSMGAFALILVVSGGGIAAILLTHQNARKRPARSGRFVRRADMRVRSAVSHSRV